MKFLYDSQSENEVMKEGKRLAEERDIQTIDTANWDETKKWEYYLGVFLPISVRYHRKLKGHIRTHKAGSIHFSCVLVTDDNFYVREKAIEKLREL